MPNFMRHELLLSEARGQLAKHRASGQPDKSFEMSYSFLGINVCRSAFMMLTGLRHNFDVTAVSLSQTPRGNLYRAYVLSR